ncbi:MAG: hypothetical protein DRQ88_09925 [Epsilonproteobacteria bacterium]|nr:MAG: hypothetical protein DRQ88_09925 [Campylobacterota bacterium]
MSDQIYIYPTDTVWGIGASIFSRDAQEEIRAIKKTSPDKPMSVLFPGKNLLAHFIDYPVLWDDLFKLEVTFLIPMSWCKQEIPDWVAKGPYLGIRCLENDELKKILEKEGAPITSTSLNLSGGGPITSLDDAMAFQNNEANSAELIHFKDHHMSGMSSTIVKVEEGNTYEIIRSGTNTSKVRDILGLSAT